MGAPPSTRNSPQSVAALRDLELHADAVGRHPNHIDAEVVQRALECHFGSVDRLSGAAAHAALETFLAFVGSFGRGAQRRLSAAMTRLAVRLETRCQGSGQWGQWGEIEPFAAPALSAELALALNDV